MSSSSPSRGRPRSASILCNNRGTREALLGTESGCESPVFSDAETAFDGRRKPRSQKKTSKPFPDLSSDPFEILRRNLKADADAQLRQAGQSREVTSSIFARANAAVHTPADLASEILSGLDGDSYDSRRRSSGDIDVPARPTAPPTTRNPSASSSPTEGEGVHVPRPPRLTEAKLDSPRLWRQAVAQTEAEVPEGERSTWQPPYRWKGGRASMEGGNGLHRIDFPASGNPRSYSYARAILVFLFTARTTFVFPLSLQALHPI